jgi:hypothetical protein
MFGTALGLPALVLLTWSVKLVRWPPPPMVGPSELFLENAGMDRILVEHNGSKDAKRELIRLFWPVCQVYEQLNTAVTPSTDTRRLGVTGLALVCQLVCMLVCAL